MQKTSRTASIPKFTAENQPIYRFVCAVLVRRYIWSEIRLAIGEEKDPYRACCLNVRRSMEIIESSLEIHKEEENGLRVAGAVYHLADGSVSFDI